MPFDVPTLLHAYRQGAFPMGDPRTGEVSFYTADPRGVMPLSEGEGFHCPRTVERMIRRGRFEVTCNTAFEAVMRGCADPRRDRELERLATEAGDTELMENAGWITDELVASYAALHRAGHAHSLEAWRTDPSGGGRVLVGGIYGVSIGAAFFGESMFHRARGRRPDGSPDPLDGSGASSVCLVLLVRHLASCGYRLFDTQMVTGHVGRFGAASIPARVYMQRLAGAVDRPGAWRAFTSGRSASRDPAG
ncbi:MAG: leucyl/phenylalanyl-tRNA--protein transferase [Phycisphaerales bacterium]|nr:leucyl/phenylalanyl-tRNA--protein transferase [Phycisphaerales bacterium]